MIIRPVLRWLINKPTVESTRNLECHPRISSCGTFVTTVRIPPLRFQVWGDIVIPKRNYEGLYALQILISFSPCPLNPPPNDRPSDSTLVPHPATPKKGPFVANHPVHSTHQPCPRRSPELPDNPTQRDLTMQPVDRPTYLPTA